MAVKTEPWRGCFSNHVSPKKSEQIHGRLSDYAILSLGFKIILCHGILRRRLYYAEARMDDQQLLEAYVHDRSQDAMSRLVSRHINLVYSAARRQTNDPHMAEDITQLTFTALARHSSRLTSERALSAWLLVTTRNAALDAAKAKARRLRHEREAAQMAKTTHDTTKEDSQWATSPSSRRGTCKPECRRSPSRLLRYFEGCTPTQVAQRLGISLDAARQRVHRATTRMRGYFSRKASTSRRPPRAINRQPRVHAARPRSPPHGRSPINRLRTYCATTTFTQATTIALAASKAKAALIAVTALLVVAAVPQPFNTS